MTIGLVMRVLDILFGTLGLLLIVRALLQVFGMRWSHPLLQIVIKVTDPIINLTNRLLGIPTYRSTYRAYSTLRSDILNAVAALVVLWAARTLLTWALQLVVLIPVWVLQPLGSIGAMLRFVLGLLFDLYGLALFVRVLFSWIQVPYSSKVTRFLWTITEPVLVPIRRALPVFCGLDLSPIVAFLLLRLLQQVVFSLLSWVF